MPRECGKIAQEQRTRANERKITAEQESAHREPQRDEDRESRRDWEQRHSRKADSQPEQIEGGSHSRRGSEKQTQREGETSRAHSRRAGDDAEQMTSRHRSERRAGAIQSRRCGRDPGEIFGRSSNHVKPDRIEESERSRISEREAQSAHNARNKKATTIKGKICLEK